MWDSILLDLARGVGQAALVPWRVAKAVAKLD
jgi:hypothetical protein